MQRALEKFRSVAGIAASGRGSSALSTVATTLDSYRLSSALGTTDNPNFVPDRAPGEVQVTLRITIATE